MIVLKLLKMAHGVRSLLDTVMQALPQVGNLALLFLLFFFMFAALGVELFGRIGMQIFYFFFFNWIWISSLKLTECSDEHPCSAMDEHANFHNFGMAFLTLFRVATGDAWNGIMKDTLRKDCDDTIECYKNCCVSTIVSPIYFILFVLISQLVLVNVVIAVLMKNLEDSTKRWND